MCVYALMRADCVSIWEKNMSKDSLIKLIEALYSVGYVIERMETASGTGVTGRPPLALKINPFPLPTAPEDNGQDQSA